jgi:hypothetical protein
MTDSARTPWRRIVVALTIGSFSVAALMGIAALLGGGDFGTPEWRVLGTTVLMGCSSMVVLTYLASVGTPYVVFGGLGGVADAIAVATALVLIWGDASGSSSDSLLKMFGVATVVALTLAQVCLLAAVAWRRPALALLLWGTMAMATVLAAMLISLILGSDIGDNGARFFGVVAIVDVLGTIVTIALAVFGDSPTRGAVTGPLSVELPAELADRLRRRAADTGRPAPALATEAVAQWLASTADRPS